jgi:hypothetical protein
MAELKSIERALQLFTAVFKNRGLGKVRSEFSEAFSNEVLLTWDKFKHWFIREDPTAEAILAKYEEAPEATAAVVQSVAESKAQQDPAFAETLRAALTRLEANHFDTINHIGEVSGKRNTIRQGSGNTGTGGNTKNEVGKVDGEDNFIEQGSYNYDPDGKKKAE